MPLQSVPMANDDDLKSELERLRAENERLKAQKTRGVSTKLLDMADDIRAFIKDNEGKLKAKGE